MLWYRIESSSNGQGEEAIKFKQRASLCRGLARVRCSDFDNKIVENYKLNGQQNDYGNDDDDSTMVQLQ